MKTESADHKVAAHYRLIRLAWEDRRRDHPCQGDRAGCEQAVEFEAAYDLKLQKNGHADHGRVRHVRLIYCARHAFAFANRHRLEVPQ